MAGLHPAYIWVPGEHSFTAPYLKTDVVTQRVGSEN
jgi:hypothetical protein